MVKKYFAIFLSLAILFTLVGCGDENEIVDDTVVDDTVVDDSTVNDSSIIYVDSSKDGDGSTWENAYGDLTTALSIAEDGNEIWVVEGTYTPESSDNDCFTMIDGVDVYGGFLGVETSVEERDYELNETILSGKISTNTTSSHVVIAANNILDGFTITEGGMSNEMPSGSGMPGLSGIPGSSGMPSGNDIPDSILLESDNDTGHSSPDQVLDGDAESSTAGGGIIIWECSPTIRNCVITDNNTGKAGGVYINDTGDLEDQPTFINCTISNNSASQRGGGVAIDMYSSPYFIDCIFDGNICNSKGGAVYDDFGSSPMLYNCLFINNEASTAAAIGNDGVSNPKIVNCTFTNNTASEAGAALYQGTGPFNDPIVINSIIYDNICENDVAGVYDWNECNTSISYSLVEDGYDGTNNFDVDPSFDSLYIATSNECLTASSNGDKIGYLGAVSNNVDDIKTMFSAITSTKQPTEIDLSNPISSTDFEGEVIYVTVDGDDSGNSWDSSTTLQNAIYIAGYLYETTANAPQIWIMNGTYTTGDERSDSFILQDGIELYGGFDGTESSLEERNYLDNKTILSGEIGDLEITTDNSYHVVVGADDVLLDGLTISGGYADGVDGEVYDSKGGGLLNYSAGNRVRPDMEPTLGFDITITNCVFENNYAYEGGAVYTYHGGNPVFENVVFQDNSAVYGGATVDRAGTNAIYNNCEFDSNVAQYKGGAVFTDYGSMSSFDECEFSNNTAGSNGGAIYVIDRASQAVPNETDFDKIDSSWSSLTDIYSSIYVVNSTFENNIANSGNDVYLYDGSYGYLNDNIYDGQDTISDNVTNVGSHLID